FVDGCCGAAETFAIASIDGYPGVWPLPAHRIPRRTQTPSGQNPHGRVDTMTCLAIGKFRTCRPGATLLCLDVPPGTESTGPAALAGGLGAISRADDPEAAVLSTRSQVCVSSSLLRPGLQAAAE